MNTGLDQRLQLKNLQNMCIGEYMHKGIPISPAKLRPIRFAIPQLLHITVNKIGYLFNLINRFNFIVC